MKSIANMPVAELKQYLVDVALSVANNNTPEYLCDVESTLLMIVSTLEFRIAREVLGNDTKI